MELNKLEIITVNAIVIHKKLNTSLLKKLLGYGAEAGVFCRMQNPETGKIFNDYIRVSKETYNLAQIGEELKLKAYRGIKNPAKIYLKPDEAVLN